MESFPVVSSMSQMQQPSLSQQPVPWMLTIPSYIPWSDPTCHNDASVMKFTAEPAFHINPSAQLTTPEGMFGATQTQTSPKDYFQQCQPQFKRKGSHLDSIPPPNKMYISEEKMVARMKELNIGSNNCSSENKNLEFNSEGSRLRFDRNATFEEIESKLALEYDDLEDLGPSTSSEEPVLVLSHELKQKISAQSDSILPPTILEKLQKPTMEVVLWKPPGGIVSDLIKSSTTDNVKKSRQKKLSKNSGTENIQDQQLLPPLADSSSSAILNNNNYIANPVLMDRKQSSFPLTMPASVLIQSYSTNPNYLDRLDPSEQMEL